MFKVSNIEKEKALLLAPMEDVTDISYRLVCRELGADVVYTEFVNAEGIIRKNEKTHKKLKIIDEERPVGIQIYGGRVEAMIEAQELPSLTTRILLTLTQGVGLKELLPQVPVRVCLKTPLECKTPSNLLLIRLKPPLR